MNMTFVQMIAELLAGKACRRNDWTPAKKHFIRLLDMPTSISNSPVLIEYDNGKIDAYRFDSDDLAHSQWKEVT